MSDERRDDIVRGLRASFSEVPSERCLSEELIAERQIEALRDGLSGIVSRDPEVLDGELVFAGTQEPVRNLIEHLKGGAPLNDFTAHGLTAVTRDQTVAYLDATLELVRRGGPWDREK